MAPTGRDGSGGRLREQVHAVMHTAQALAGIVAGSLAEVEHVVSLPQLRILVIVATRGPLNLNALATAARVHPSNATRACDPLVARGLLARGESTVDRRQVELMVTEQGREILASVLRYREAAIADVLGRMPPARRAGFVLALESFAEVAGETVDDGLWQWHPGFG